MHTIAEIRQGQLAQTSTLKISQALTKFPPEILKLAETLEVLDLSGNQLSALPNSFARLKHLKILFLSNNQFEIFPSILAECPSLSMIGIRNNQMKVVPEDSLPLTTRWLILTDNLIDTLPDSIGQLSHLRKLMLAGNQLMALPESMAQCQALQLLRVSANRLPMLPDFLFNLPELSWLAFSGNPLCKPFISPTTQLPIISWSDIHQHAVLGQGASGVVSEATWRKIPDVITDTEQPIAIKKYKGSLTSDGYSQDELAAAIAAGQHNNLIPVIAKIGHNNHTGLLMQKINDEYKNLGHPPSMQSCTRDQFDENTRLADTEISGIAVQVAETMLHLLQKEICHGDLYAHNILVNHAADILLSDFGAASSYASLPETQSEAMQKIEVRAFGCLLDDLLEISTGTDSDLRTHLEDLRDRCMQKSIDHRPLFAKILSEFTEIEQRHSQR